MINHIKNQKTIISITIIILICIVIYIVITCRDASKINTNQSDLSDNKNICSNSYADDQEARIIEEAEKNGEIIYENSQTYEDDDIPGNGNTVTIND